MRLSWLGSSLVKEGTDKTFMQLDEEFSGVYCIWVHRIGGKILRHIQIIFGRVQVITFGHCMKNFNF